MTYKFRANINPNTIIDFTLKEFIEKYDYFSIRELLIPYIKNGGVIELIEPNISQLEDEILETTAANITVTKYHDMYFYSCTDDISPFYVGEGKTREEALLNMYENIKNNNEYDDYKKEGLRANS